MNCRVVRDKKFLSPHLKLVATLPCEIKWHLFMEYSVYGNLKHFALKYFTHSTCLSSCCHFCQIYCKL